MIDKYFSGSSVLLDAWRKENYGHQCDQKNQRCQELLSCGHAREFGLESVSKNRDRDEEDQIRPYLSSRIEQNAKKSEEWHPPHFRYEHGPNTRPSYDPTRRNRATQPIFDVLQQPATSWSCFSIETGFKVRGSMVGSDRSVCRKPPI